MMLPIASCGQGGSEGGKGAEPAKKDASASASPAGHQSEAASKSLEQVEKDLRFATGPHGELNVQDRPPGGCVVNAVVPTMKVLGNTAMKEVVTRLQTRGWTPDGPVEQISDNEADGSAGFVTSGEWRVVVGSGPVPPEVKEAYVPHQGMIVIGASWPCHSEGTPTSRPSPTAKPRPSM
jgi:hypothetical protein